MMVRNELLNGNEQGGANAIGGGHGGEEGLVFANDINKEVENVGRYASQRVDQGDIHKHGTRAP